MRRLVRKSEIQITSLLRHRIVDHASPIGLSCIPKKLSELKSARNEIVGQVPADDGPRRMLRLYAMSGPVVNVTFGVGWRRV